MFACAITYVHICIELCLAILRYIRIFIWLRLSTYIYRLCCIYMYIYIYIVNAYIYILYILYIKYINYIIYILIIYSCAIYWSWFIAYYSIFQYLYEMHVCFVYVCHFFKRCKTLANWQPQSFQVHSYLQLLATSASPVVGNWQGIPSEPDQRETLRILVFNVHCIHHRQLLIDYVWFNVWNAYGSTSMNTHAHTETMPTLKWHLRHWLRWRWRVWGHQPRTISRCGVVPQCHPWLMMVDYCWRSHLRAIPWPSHWIPIFWTFEGFDLRRRNLSLTVLVPGGLEACLIEPTNCLIRLQVQACNQIGTSVWVPSWLNRQVLLVDWNLRDPLKEIITKLPQNPKAPLLQLIIDICQRTPVSDHKSYMDRWWPLRSGMAGCI